MEGSRASATRRVPPHVAVVNAAAPFPPCVTRMEDVFESDKETCDFDNPYMPDFTNALVDVFASRLRAPGDSVPYTRCKSGDNVAARAALPSSI
jgi:hypothetical protein